MGTIEIFPAATVKEQGSKTLTGGASSLAVLSDGSDASYLRAAGSLATNWSATFLMQPLTLPAGAIVERVQLRMRYSHAIKAPPNSEILKPVTVLIGRQTGSGHTFTGFTQGEAVPSYSTALTPQVWTGPFRASTYDGKAWLGLLLLQTGARIYATADVGRGFAWNTARLYSLSVLVHYNERPTVTLTAPTGTQVVSRPTISWDWVDVDGNQQSYYEARIYTQAQVTAPGFDINDPGRIPPVYRAGIYSASTTHVVDRPFGADGNYRAYVRAAHGPVSGSYLWSDWSSQDFTLDVEAPAAPTLTAGYDADAHAVLVEAHGLDNMLSWGHSTFEVVPDPPLIAGANTTLTRTQAQAAHGTWSYQVTRTGSTGTATATVHQASGATWGVPIDGGSPYSARASFRAATTGRSCRITLEFYNVTGALVGSTTGANVTDNSSGWVEATVGPTTAPAAATHARIRCEILSAAATESHYLDKVGLFPGTATAWNRGGWDDYEILLQRSLDAGTTWEDIPDTHATLGWDPLTRTLTYADYEVPSATTATYRARAEGDNQDGDPIAGDWSTTASATMAAFTDWWIRDLSSPGALSMPIQVASKTEDEAKPQTVDFPLDSDAAVVSHDGTKRPALDLEMWLLSKYEHDLFREIIGTGRTLLLQDTLGQQWYVQTGERTRYEQLRAAPAPGDTAAVRHAHRVDVRFVSVEKPLRRV